MDEKYLIIRPKYGLCNQLYSISKGIIFGLITKRNIIFNGFQLDYRNDQNLCKFSDIIDIHYLQKKLDEKNIHIKIYCNSDCNGNKLKTFSNENISYIQDFIPLLLHEINLEEPFLDIDNPISSTIPNDYLELSNYINVHIKFVDKYIKLANNIKKNFKLHNYTCVHLRLENDSLQFMNDKNNKYTLDEVNTIYKKKYIDELEYLKLKNISNHQIYVCTSLCIFDNINNDFYQQIKKDYNLIDKNNFINVSDYKCREIYGIIDYIIAKDSLYFIGSDWSSFSIYIYENHIYNKKAAKLIDIYQTIIQ